MQDCSDAEPEQREEVRKMEVRVEADVTLVYSGARRSCIGMAAVLSIAGLLMSVYTHMILEGLSMK
jgi:hypothetical protein